MHASHSPSAALNPRITAIGAFVPERKLTNDDMEKLVETNDEWIVQRTGIRERRIASEGEYCSDFAIGAVQNMIDTYQIDVTDVDMVIVATHTPDFVFPSVACQVQAHFKISQTGAMDLNATCAGFAYGLHVANGLIASGLHKKVLVIGTDNLTRETDYTDRTTCILFGDGAGAVLVEGKEGVPSAFIASRLGSDGSGGKHVYRAGLSDTMDGEPLKGDGKLVQNGREVYKFAVTTVSQGASALLEQSNMTPADLNWFIPHSANLRIIESISERIGIPMEKTLYSLEYYGNTSAASIPLALHLGIQEGKVKPGDTMLLYGFGGGLTHCGVLVQWG